MRRWKESGCEAVHQSGVRRSEDERVMVTIRCNSCGEALAARLVDVQRLVATCESCHRVFDIRDQLPAPMGAMIGARSRRIPAPPASIRVIGNDGDEGTASSRTHHVPRIAIEHRNSRTRAGPGALLCIFLCALLANWHRGRSGSEGAMEVVVFLAFTVGTVILVYRTIAAILNHTRIEVAGDRLVVRDGPLPRSASCSVQTSDVEQLFCQENVSSRGVRAYSLNALLKNGTRMTLLGGINDADACIFLELELERCLGIDDAPVTGEYV